MNSETGIGREIVTGSTGEFFFALLPPATQRLIDAAQGFNLTTQENIVLRARGSVTDNVMLKVASTSEQVTVTSAAPLLQTDNANVITEVSTKQVQDLPLNLQNVTELDLMNSSVNNQTQQQLMKSGGQEDTAEQDESFLSFWGGIFGTDALLLDGSRKVSVSWGGIIYVTSGFRLYTDPFVPIRQRSWVFLESEGAGL